ncbi:MAG: hypothetical protein ACREXS_01140 [Gammaproteobacteria bacterium]
MPRGSYERQPKAGRGREAALLGAALDASWPGAEGGHAWRAEGATPV